MKQFMVRVCTHFDLLLKSQQRLHLAPGGVLLPLHPVEVYLRDRQAAVRQESADLLHVVSRLVP